MRGRLTDKAQGCDRPCSPQSALLGRIVDGGYLKAQGAGKRAARYVPGLKRGKKWLGDAFVRADSTSALEIIT